MDPNPPTSDPSIYTFDAQKLTAIKPTTADQADTQMMPAIRDEPPAPPPAPPEPPPRPQYTRPAPPPQHRDTGTRPGAGRAYPPRHARPPVPEQSRRPDHPPEDPPITWPLHPPGDPASDPAHVLNTDASPAIVAACALRVAEELDKVYNGHYRFAEVKRRADDYRHSAAAITRLHSTNTTNTTTQSYPGG